MREAVRSLEEEKVGLLEELDRIRKSKHRYRMIFDHSYISIWEEDYSEVFAALNALTQSLRPLSLAAVGGLLLFLSAPVVLIGCGVAVAVSGLGGAWVKGVREL